MRDFLKFMSAVIGMAAVVAFAQPSQAALVIGEAFVGPADVIGPINNPGETDIVHFNIGAGSFADAWTFTADSFTSGIDTLVANITHGSFSTISDFEIGLVEGGSVTGGEFSDGTIVAVGTVVSTFLAFSYADLLDGSLYAFVVLGEAGSGLFTGSYAGEATISAVPLPPAAWLFLSALVGLVGVVRHKRKRPVSGAGVEGTLADA